MKECIAVAIVAAFVVASAAGAAYAYNAAYSDHVQGVEVDVAYAVLTPAEGTLTAVVVGGTMTAGYVDTAGNPSYADITISSQDVVAGATVGLTVTTVRNGITSEVKVSAVAVEDAGTGYGTVTFSGFGPLYSGGTVTVAVDKVGDLATGTAVGMTITAHAMTGGSS